MTISVVACGNTASEWYKIPCDLSIGVNDVLKFGASPDWLLCINGMNKFTDERRQTIMNTRPKKFFSHNTGWLNHFALFCESERIAAMHSWRGYVKKGRLYSSLTSPIVAMCLAFNAGATDMIIWGVDFENHPNFPKDSYSLKRELKIYHEMIACFEAHGCRAWSGTANSTLNLPTWPSQNQLK